MGFKLGQKIIDKLRGKNSLKEKIKDIDSRVAYIWQKGGMLPLTPEFKQKNIKEYAKEYNCKILIETGTYLGDTVNALKNDFDEIFTIELSKDLFEKATKRFNNVSKIHCYQGNSKDILPNILDNINQIPIFWLDAHYSAGITAKGDKDTPIIEELKIILSKLNKTVILIDDAREFGTEADYPSLFNVECLIKKSFPKADFKVYNDVIRIIIGY